MPRQQRGGKLARVQATIRHRVALSAASITLLLFVAHFFNDFFSGTLAALLPTLQVRFGVSEVTLALFVATLSFSSSVVQPLFGAVADRLGRRLVAAVGVAATSVILSLIVTVPTAALLIPLLLLGGLGSAAFHPAGTTLARQAAGSKGGLALGLFSAAGTTGMAFGPLVVGLFIINGWLSFTPLLMLPGVVAGVLLYLLLPEQAPVARVSRAKLFDIELFKGPVGLLCLAGVLRSVAWTAVINGAPLWLVNSKGLSATSPVVFWTITVFTISGGAGGIIAGLLEGRLSRQALVTGSMLLALVPLATLLLSVPGTVLYFAGVAGAGLLVNGGLPIMVVSAQDAAPHAVATASGMMMGLTWGTAGVLYLGVGALQEAIGMNAAMWLSLVPLVPGALIAYRVLRKLAEPRAELPASAH